ncbi:MAG: hypothetical protein ACJ76V_05320 [Thermoleophilaceae bacterium]
MTQRQSSIARPATRIGPAFFVPGHDVPDQGEAAYAVIRDTVAISTGHVPRDRRIWRLSARRGGRDCITEVGAPDPLTTELVVAILDLGTHQPFVVYSRCGHGGDEIEELQIRQVYEVFEFPALV